MGTCAGDENRGCVRWQQRFDWAGGRVRWHAFLHESLLTRSSTASIPQIFFAFRKSRSRPRCRQLVSYQPRRGVVLAAIINAGPRAKAAGVAGSSVTVTSWFQVGSFGTASYHANQLVAVIARSTSIFNASISSMIEAFYRRHYEI